MTERAETAQNLRDFSPGDRVVVRHGPRGFEAGTVTSVGRLIDVDLGDEHGSWPRGRVALADLIPEGDECAGCGALRNRRTQVLIHVDLSCLVASHNRAALRAKDRLTLWREAGR